MASVSRRIWRSPGGVKRTAWGFSLVLNGKQVKSYREGWTRGDAQEALAKALLHVEPPKPKADGMTFGEAVERYLAAKEAERKRSIAGDRLTLARLRAAFGDATPLSEVTASRIADYKVARAKERPRTGSSGETVSSATVNRELAALRCLLRLAAEEWGWLDRAPRVRLLREPQGRLRFLAEDEIVRLQAACARSQNPHLGTIVTVALNTGMRLGEIMGLAWERVDFSRGVVLLERTKSGRRREVPMNAAVDAALHGLPGDKAEGRVFRKAGGAAWGSIRTAWENACREAKVENFRFHDLRHTFASHMMMRGASLGDLREILGHADIRMTMRYAHLSQAHKRAAVARLDGLTTTVDSAVDNPPQIAHGLEQGAKIGESAPVST